LWTELVDAGDQQGNAKRPAHHSILVMHTLTKAEGKVAHRLCDTLDFDALVISERVILGRDPGVIDHGPRIGGKTGDRAAEMCVDLHDLFYRRGLKQGRLNALLDTKDYAFWGTDAYSCRAKLEVKMSIDSMWLYKLAYFDCLDSIFNWAL
jgi:hypothetical protein